MPQTTGSTRGTNIHLEYFQKPKSCYSLSVNPSPVHQQALAAEARAAKASYGKSDWWRPKQLNAQVVFSPEYGSTAGLHLTNSMTAHAATLLSDVNVGRPNMSPRSASGWPCSSSTAASRERAGYFDASASTRLPPPSPRY